eukprot:scaffold211644_cov16-Tisochrysis_lutea.AAC.2
MGQGGAGGLRAAVHSEAEESAAECSMKEREKERLYARQARLRARRKGSRTSERARANELNESSGFMGLGTAVRAAEPEHCSSQ